MNVQLLGSTRLTRVVVPWLLEHGRARIVGIDPGDEDESRPWFAPIRQLARDNGIFLGRSPADLVLDLDPDARPVTPEGIAVRVFAPADAASPDINRALLIGGEWSMVVTDGRAAWASEIVRAFDDDDAQTLLDRATLRGLEALAGSFEAILAGTAPVPLARGLKAGHWRAQESFLLWNWTSEAVARRVRATSGPWGGARTHLGDATVWILEAEVGSTERTPDHLPGTIVATTPYIEVATGNGTVRIHRLRPGWRPARSAAEYAEEVGVIEGHQFV